MAKHSYFDAYKLSFIHDETQPSLRDFGKKQGVEDDWDYARQKYWAEVGKEVSERMKGMHVHDTTLKLREIQALKNRAWEGAFEADFKTADRAIASFSELEKLERLILGQSTENITIQQLDAYMMQVVKIIKEEVTDVMMLEAVRVRLSQLRLGDSSSADASSMSN